MTASERLLEVAQELVVERGPGGFTLREAARRAGISHATPGYLFGDLRGVVTQLAIGGLERFAEALEAAERRIDLPTSFRLLAVGQAYVEFACAEPQIFRLMFGDEYVDQTNAVLNAATDRAFGPMHRLMRELHGVSVDTPEFMTRVHITWSAVHGLARLLLDRVIIPDAEDRNAAIHTILLAFGPALREPLPGGNQTS